jgi:hypothetical protein
MGKNQRAVMIVLTVVTLVFAVTGGLGLPPLPLPTPTGQPLISESEFRAAYSAWGDHSGLRYAYWTWLWLGGAYIFGSVAGIVGYWSIFEKWVYDEESARILLLPMIVFAPALLLIGLAPLGLSLMHLPQSNYLSMVWSVSDALQVAAIPVAIVLLYGGFALTMVLFPRRRSDAT